MSAAYADESGDPGYQFQAGSSPLFVITILLPSEPEALLNRVLDARRRLGKPETFEFHFPQARQEIRRVFFEAVAPEAWSLFTAVIHKRHSPPALRQAGKRGLYVHSLGGLALRAPVPFDGVKLHLDGTGSQKEFIQALKTGVRAVCREAGRPAQSFKEIRILNSSHPLIQCADMVTGAVAEQAATGQSVWYRLIQAKVGIWWEENFGVKQNPPD
jgi:hypothetical protein